ncbi:MAG: glycerophosphodiester phosphodiesterase family protein [Clostridia bacterium]|nr:glycerophosphodiester phosphodiesterase family protein [Clostridia bacterium]
MMKKIFSIIIAIIILLSFQIFADAQVNIGAFTEAYKNPNGKTMIVSDKGDITTAPENSLMAIHNAEKAGADIIKIDVRTTADGVLVLMADETVVRTCNGYGENTVVSEMTYEEIKQLNLLGGKGGYGAKNTTLTVPTLEEVFDDRKLSYLSSASVETKQKSLFMLDFDWSIRDKISNLVIENNMGNEVIFYIDDAAPDEITAWKETLPFEPMIMTYFKGNVIFAATANVKNDAEIADGIHLATKNPYGVIFGETVQDTAKESGIRTMASASRPEICGTQIQDTEVWWDYLITQGFNVIMTDHVKELRAYLDDCNEKEWFLEKYFYDTIEGYSLPDFNSDKFLDYKRAYNNAYDYITDVINDHSSSRSDIVTAEYEIKKAIDDIHANYNALQEGTAGMTVNPLTILLSTFAIAIVTVAEIYVYKKKKK